MSVQSLGGACLACLALAGLLSASAALAADAPKDLNPGTVKPAPSHPPIVLVDNGVAKVTICLMDPNNSVWRHVDLAVKELTAAIAQAADLKAPQPTTKPKGPAQPLIPISRGKLVDGPAIVIGNCPEAAAAGLDGAKMPIEGFAIKTAPNRIYIVGHDEAALNSPGTAWGVYDFLERALGVRWYWPADQGGRSVATAKTLAVQPMWVEDAPFFRMREIWPSIGNLGPLHAALRSNNSWPVKLNVHAPHAWAKYEDFGKTRPEIFQLRKDGSRDPIMLCYSNPRTLETYLEVLSRVYDKKDPNSGGIVNGNSITVSPWDAEIACACPDCQKLMDPNGGAWGTASRILGTFVSKLGNEVKKRWPDKTVIHLPYLNYTMAPTGIEFPDNVEVQLCGMPGVAMYKEPSVYKKFQGNIDTWRGLTHRKVQTWDYSCWPEDFIKAPYHYPHVVKMYYQANKDKIVGSFINGERDHWPRQNITLYCWEKLLWNPDFDVDAAMDEFCKRMFGPAAGTMRELLRMQCDGWEKSRWPNGALSSENVYRDSFPKESVAKIKELLAKAREQIGDDPLLTKRLDYYQTPFADFYKEYEFVVEGKGMRTLAAKKVGENPTMDGKLDDPVWARATEVTLRKHVAQGEANCLFPTTVKAVWTMEGVTFGIRMAESKPEALRKDMNSRDDGTLWWQDCVEVFLDPSGKNSGTSAQILLTAGGGLLDSWGGDGAWTCEGLKYAIHVDKDYWSVEIYVPFKSLPNAVIPGSGTATSWYGQITRHRLADTLKPDGSKGGAENQKMNATFGGFNSNTGDFGVIKFEE